jgi:GT2 family glycosyltransferase
MLVSVIIPNHNGEKTICNTLESIYKQGIRPIEIIVVDDCSTDNSIKKIKRNYKRVKIIKNMKRIFAAQARNIGINSARGKNLLFIDNDVKLENGALKKMISKLKTTDIVFPTILFENNVPMYPRTLEDKKYPGISAVFMIKRKSLNKLDSFFDETYQIYFEDVDFFQRCRLVGLKAKYVDDAIAYHAIKPAFNKEYQYFLYIRNFLYGYIKFFGIRHGVFRGLVPFMFKKFFINAILNYAWQERYYQPIKKSFLAKLHLVLKCEKITKRSRAFLILLFFKAIVWNLKNIDYILSKRAKFFKYLNELK